MKYKGGLQLFICFLYYRAQTKRVMLADSKI